MLDTLARGSGMQFGQLKRREFITLLGGAMAWPLTARAQRPAMPLIGFFNGQTAAGSVHLTAAFHVGLGEGGFTEGRNVAIEYRWANGDGQRMRPLAEELIDLRVAVLVATGGAHLAAKAATASVPIVCRWETIRSNKVSPRASSGRAAM